MSAAIKLKRTMFNLTFVKVDRDAAIANWNAIASGIGSIFNEDNRKILLTQKAVAGICGFKSNNFYMHAVRERMVQRRVSGKKLPSSLWAA